MVNNRELGGKGESLASDYLRGIGYKVVRTNYYAKRGEIDIIALRHGVLLFVEVKYRRDLTLGYPVESITASKVRRLRGAVLEYLQSDECPQHDNLKFDAICVLELPGRESVLEHIEDILGP